MQCSDATARQNPANCLVNDSGTVSSITVVRSPHTGRSLLAGCLVLAQEHVVLRCTPLLLRGGGLLPPGLPPLLWLRWADGFPGRGIPLPQELVILTCRGGPVCTVGFVLLEELIPPGRTVTLRMCLDKRAKDQGPGDAQYRALHSHSAYLLVRIRNSNAILPMTTVASVPLFHSGGTHA